MDLIEEETGRAVAAARDAFSAAAESRTCEVAMGDSRHGMNHGGGDRTSAAEWDERYGEQDRLFSGNPNDVLVAEVTGVQPGQALDVGCGEGGDAIWLAAQGWKVTATDISRVAVERGAAAAAEHAPDVAAGIAWVRADLGSEHPPTSSFDLVTAQYFALKKERGEQPVRALLEAVAPGGVLLFVGHDPAAFPPDAEFDPDEYVQPTDVAKLLDDDWAVETDETRPRTGPARRTTRTTWCSRRGACAEGRRGAAQARCAAPDLGDLVHRQVQGIAQAHHGAEGRSRQAAGLDLAQRLRGDPGCTGDLGGVPARPGVPQHLAHAGAGGDLIGGEGEAYHESKVTVVFKYLQGAIVVFKYRRCES